MANTLSRTLVWTALFLSAGFLLLLLLVAATGSLNAGWYYLGAAVYTAIILMLLVAVLLRRDESTAVVLETVAEEEESVHERVLYTTANGEVTERVRTNATGSESDFKISHRGAKKTLDEVERRVDRSGWDEADLPTDRDFRDALRRYGRVREVN